MAQRVESAEINIQHGHNDDQVVVIFPRPVTQLGLRIDQAEVFISAMKNSIEKLKAHQAGQRKPS